MALFYSSIWKDPVSLLRFPFSFPCLCLLVRNVASFSFEIPMQLFFFSFYILDRLFSLSVFMLPITLLTALIHVSLLFFMWFSAPFIDASTQSLLLARPFLLSFLDIYNSSFLSHVCKYYLDASNIEQVLEAISTRHQLYGHLPPLTKTIKVRRTRYAGHCWRSRDELISDVHLWTPHMAEKKQDGQLEHTYSSYVRIRDVALKTWQRRWTIRRSGERVSGIPVLTTRHDDDDVKTYYFITCKFFTAELTNVLSLESE